MVTLMLLGQTLREMADEPELELEIAGPTTVKALLETHADKVSRLLDLLSKGEVLITVNRKVGASDSPVRDGDTVKLTHNPNPSYDGPMWQNP